MTQKSRHLSYICLGGVMLLITFKLLVMFGAVYVIGRMMNVFYKREGRE